MLSTPNGCTCASANLEYGTCIACRGRKKEAERGHTCRECGVGLFPGEKERRVCSNCEYG